MWCCRATNISTGCSFGPTNIRGILQAPRRLRSATPARTARTTSISMSQASAVSGARRRFSAAQHSPLASSISMISTALAARLLTSIIGCWEDSRCLGILPKTRYLSRAGQATTCRPRKAGRWSIATPWRFTRPGRSPRRNRSPTTSTTTSGTATARPSTASTPLTGSRTSVPTASSRARSRPRGPSEFRRGRRGARGYCRLAWV